MITHPLCQHTHSGHLPKQEAKGLMYYEPLKDTKKSQFSGVLSLLAYAVLCFSHKRCFRQREFQSSTIFFYVEANVNQPKIVFSLENGSISLENGSIS